MVWCWSRSRWGLVRVGWCFCFWVARFLAAQVCLWPPVTRSGVARLPTFWHIWPAAEELTAFEQLRPFFRPNAPESGAFLTSALGNPEPQEALSSWVGLGEAVLGILEALVFITFGWRVFLETRFASVRRARGRALPDFPLSSTFGRRPKNSLRSNSFGLFPAKCARKWRVPDVGLRQT